MTKDQLRKHREDIHGLRLEMYQIQENIRVMESRAMRATTVITDEPKGGSQIHDSMAEIASRVCDKEREIQRLIIIQDDVIREVETAIAILPPLERAIFRTYYVECVRTWAKVAALHNYSEDYIWHLHGAGLERLRKDNRKKGSNLC